MIKQTDIPHISRGLDQRKTGSRSLLTVGICSQFNNPLAKEGVVKGWIVFSGKAKMRTEAQFTRSK